MTLFLIRCYQGFLSPLMPLGCKFYPSCSHYAAEAIHRHGTRPGLLLAARRILRCRPFACGGYDPVPQARPSERAVAASHGAVTPSLPHPFHPERAR